MADNSQLRGTRFSQTATGTTVASATFYAANAIYITDISGSSTGTAGTWAILGGVTGTTVYWQGSGAVNTPISESIRVFSQPLGGTVTFYMNGATATYANISGYTI